MSLKRKIYIVIACLLLVLMIEGIGVTLGYFSDTEVSVDNIMRFKNGW